MPYLNEATQMLRADAATNTARGHKFERIMLAALRDHPGEYGPARFTDLWQWNDWPARRTRQHSGDIGIDLVGEQTPEYGGGLCAIQCKFYDDRNKVATSDVDKFLAASDSDEWTARIFVATTDYSRPAEQKLRDARNTEILTGSKLNAWPLDWRELVDRPDQAIYAPSRYTPRPDQRDAVAAVVDGLRRSGRGRLVMPCGTGKSVVALWAAEELCGQGGQALYLVPSISLMDQIMREWAAQCSFRHRYLGVCSDAKVGRKSSDSYASLSELAMPVTTDVQRIVSELKREMPAAMTTVFCTYQSLPKVCEAQQHGGPSFDLVICDEAHRTTGVTEQGDDTGLFTLVHDAEQLKARRRLYMTATQRIYTETAKQRATGDVISMDDESLYGPALYEMKFSHAIDAGLLSDYEVVVIGVAESAYDDLLGPAARNGVEVTAADGKQTTVDFEDMVKLLGCWDALADPATLGPRPDRAVGEVEPGVDPCRRTIAFTNTVRASKQVAAALTTLTQRAVAARSAESTERVSLCLDAHHVEGGMNAFQRSSKLDWLRDSASLGPAEARLLSNARCLSEGVDVPALDAVVFLAPKRSDTDIVQAVGRVMRQAPGKTCGHVVLPVVVPEGQLMHSDEVIEGSDFKQVFRVLRALRSHDERLDVLVNSPRRADRIPMRILDRVVVEDPEDPEWVQERLALSNLLATKIASAVVDHVGDRQYWPSWGRRTATVCKKVQAHLDAAATENHAVQEALVEFAHAIRRTSIPSFRDEDAREMVAQHVVTIPVFDAFFARSQFASRNPVSVHINKLLVQLAAAGVEFDQITQSLADTYQRIAQVISNAEAKEKLDVLRQVYEGFFKAAIPDMVSRLGIVYTPLPVVDFMLKSVDAVCRKELNRGLTDDGVTILDPFTGTGTFIARLLSLCDSDGQPLIDDHDVGRKYRHELQATERVMLPYYIAALQIEEAAATRGVFGRPGEMRGGGYDPFPGITLADTFMSGTPAMQNAARLFHQDQLASGEDVPENSNRARTQETTPIKVIIGNPPWSAGQRSSGDDNPNEEYPEMAQRVRNTYGEKQLTVTGRSGGGNSAGNLYVKALRWASDRLRPLHDDDNAGWVVAFVHPNSLTTATSLAGMRAALRDEFTSIYVVNLRGDAYKSGNEFKLEGDKIFGSGSRNGAQITVLVRNPHVDPACPARLYYAQTPDYASLEEKFQWLASVGDVTSDELTQVPLDERHDWVNLSDGSYQRLMPVCETGRNRGPVAVRDHARGVTTTCDPYVYSFSREDLAERVRRLIDAYETARRIIHGQGEPNRSADRKAIAARVEEVTVNDRLHEIKWTDCLKTTLRRGDVIEFDPARIRECLYRPFTKLWLYEDDRILSSVKTVSAMFPRDQDPASMIVTGGSDNGSPDTVLATGAMPDLNSIGPARGGGGRALGYRRFC